MGIDTVRASRKTGHLLRILGVGFGIAVGVGNTIGTGILRTPGEVASYLGSASLVFAVWILGGVYALLCSSSVTDSAPCSRGQAVGMCIRTGHLAKE